MDAFRYFIYFACLFNFVYCKHELYDGHSVYEVSVTDVKQVEFINHLENALLLDVWRYPSPARPGQIMVPQGVNERFRNELFAAGIEFEVLTENVKELLELEDRLMAAEASKNSTTSKNSRVQLPLNRILTLLEVDVYLHEIARAYPEVATLHSAGKSFEGRDIWYLKVSTTNFQDKRKPVVFIQSLLHAREWITLPASLYAIQELVVEASEHKLLHEVDWIIMPVANPDGYLFSHIEGRFWRKNRADDYSNICVGVDLNRNFDFNWGQASSNVVCMDTFHGRGPFSEPETAAIRDVMHEHAGRIKLYIDLHSFGSMILYGYGDGSFPINVLTLNMVAVRQATAIDAVKTSWNKNYVVGNSALVLYEASGISMDYAKRTGIPLAYIYELPGRRFGTGLIGFLVDASFIRQAGMETWEGIKAAAEYVRTNKLL